MRDRIERLFAAWGRFAYRRPWPVIGLVLLIVGSLASQLPKFSFDTSMEGFLHEDDPTLGEYKPPSATADADNMLTEEGRTILDTAKLDRTMGNSDLARSGFQEFLGKYPDSEAADDANYWLGDLWYGDGDWSQALDYFQRLMNDFPDSEYIPSALLKGRSCLLELDRSEEAWQMGGELIERYPDSTEAALLKEETGQ